MLRAFTTHSFKRIKPYQLSTTFASCRWYSGVPTFMSVNNAIDLINTHKNDMDILFIDTRSPEKFEEGSINGAINIHDLFTYVLSESTESDVTTMKEHFTQILKSNDILCLGSEHIIIYEDDLTKCYGSSCRGYFIFKYMGHPNVSVLEGGYQGILQLDEKKQKQIKSIKNTEYKLHHDNIAFGYNDKWMCGCQDVLDVILGRRKAHLLDVRDEVEWDGSSSSPYGIDFTPRKGRLPGAKWIEWYEFMDKNGKVKSKQQVEQLMNKNDIKKEDDIIVYCFKGSRASNTLMILNEYGYKNISNYFASWNEWSRNMEFPIDDTLLKKKDA
eukprot:335420_1